MAKPILLCILAAAFLTSGCVSTLRKGVHFDTYVKEIKTIAVLPPRIDVYKLTAGGVQELMDEWNKQAVEFTNASLHKHLGDRYGLDLKFIEKEWLKSNYRELWLSNEALYKTVAISAMTHAYPGMNTFPQKIKSFDYTMGSDISALAQACGADTLVFVYGFDNEATAGRKTLQFWNILVGAATGVMVLLNEPSLMSIAVVNGSTGDVEWFKMTPPQSEYSFRSASHIDKVTEWLTRDFLGKK